MLIALRVVLLLSGVLLIVGTAVNFSKHPHWLVRIWDFPRVTTAILAAAVGTAYGIFFHGQWYDRQIQISLDHATDQIGSKVFLCIDQQVRMRVTKLGDKRRDEIRHHRLDGPNCDFASQ